MNETPQGMKREDKGQKLNHLSYWTPLALDRYARHMKIGEIKHGRANFQKGGYPPLEYLESTMRHLLAAWANLERLGATVGPDGEDHLAAIIFNSQALMNEEARTAESPISPSQQ